MEPAEFILGIVRDNEISASATFNKGFLFKLGSNSRFNVRRKIGSMYRSVPMASIYFTVQPSGKDDSRFRTACISEFSTVSLKIKYDVVVTEVYLWVWVLDPLRQRWIRQIQ